MVLQDVSTFTIFSSVFIFGPQACSQYPHSPSFFLHSSLIFPHFHMSQSPRSFTTPTYQHFYAYVNFLANPLCLVSPACSPVSGESYSPRSCRCCRGLARARSSTTRLSSFSCPRLLGIHYPCPGGNVRYGMAHRLSEIFLSWERAFKQWLNNSRCQHDKTRYLWIITLFLYPIFLGKEKVVVRVHQKGSENTVHLRSRSTVAHPRRIDCMRCALCSRRLRAPLLQDPLFACLLLLPVSRAWSINRKSLSIHITDLGLHV